MLKVLAGVVACFYVMAAWANDVATMKGLVESGDLKAAFNLGEELQDEFIGDPEYDFYFGLAAVETGHAQHAVFSFERLLLLEPDNQRVKLELARAQLIQGNVIVSKQLFNEVLSAQPPQRVREKINVFLDVISAREKSRDIATSVDVSVGAGYDTNINSATDVLTPIVGPGFIPLSLSEDSREQDAAFTDMSLALNVTRPVSQRSAHFLKLQYSQRDNDDLFSSSLADNQSLSLSGGWLSVRGQYRYRIPVAFDYYSLESEETRYLASFGLEVNRLLSVNSNVGGFVQLSTAHYPSEEARNLNSVLFGGSYSQSLSKVPLRFSSSLLFGLDTARKSQFDFNGRRLIGVRFNTIWSFAKRHSLSLSGGVQDYSYSEVNPALGYKRKDQLLHSSLAWRWQMRPSMSLSLKVDAQDNDSDKNQVFDFNRTVSVLNWQYSYR